MTTPPAMSCPRCWSASSKCALCGGTGKVPDAWLSTNFRLSEFLRSGLAVRKSIPNEPTPREIENLHRVAQALELVRGQFGPVMVTSGFRSLLLNKLIGGARTSAHLHGHAADFIVAGATPWDIAQWTRTGVAEFDQVIDEPGWCHLGVRSPKGEIRREVLQMRKLDGRVTYRPIPA